MPNENDYSNRIEYVGRHFHHPCLIRTCIYSFISNSNVKEQKITSINQLFSIVDNSLVSFIL
jgi:hypothetical protein